MRRVGDLECAQDLAFQRRAWRLQRIAWAGMLLVLVAGAAGLLGSGPMSRGTVGAAAGLLVEYDRFTRANAEARLHAFVGATGAGDGTLRLWIDRAYLSVVDVEQVTPPPESVEAAPDRLTYLFLRERADGPVVVTFRLKPREFGWHAGRLGLEDGPRVAFRQLVYP